MLPLPLDRAELVLELTGLKGGHDGTDAAFVALDLPAVVSPPPVPMERLESLSVSLVPGTASSAIVRGRRLHRFAVHVDGELAPTSDGKASDAAARTGSATSSPPAGPIAVTGLEDDVAAHFRVWEDGNLDPESPVHAAWRSEPVTVYLVLDTSAGIVFAGAADPLLDAVARTLAALSPVATFDYRTVSTEVHRVRGLRDVEFDTDTASGSGTAFHHAIGTVVDDIEARDDVRTVVIGFTDGRDFASRNFHPEFGSDDRVLRHVTERLRRLRASRSIAGGDGRGFELHVASLGADIDVGALDALVEAGGGRYVSSADAGALEAAFGRLTAGLRGRYRLEYSSQRLADDAALELEVRAGDLSDRVSLPYRLSTGPVP